MKMNVRLRKWRKCCVPVIVLDVKRAARRATRAGLGINSLEEVGDLFVERIIRVELFCCRINRKSDNPKHEEQSCEPSQRNGSQPRSGRLCSCSPKCGRQTQKNAGG